MSPMAAPTTARRLGRRLGRVVPQLPIALVVAVVVEIGLRVTTLPRLARVLGIRVATGQATLDNAEPVLLPRSTRRPVTAALTVVRHWPLGDTCLRRCLVVGHRLRRQEPVLRLGVRTDADGSLLAHSWLEIRGRSIDPSSDSFLPLQRR